MKTRLPKLKIEISCEVLPDGSLGRVEIRTTAQHRSGYSLTDPFESPAYQQAASLIDGCFRRTSGGSDRDR